MAMVPSMTAGLCYIALAGAPGLLSKVETPPPKKQSAQRRQQEPHHDSQYGEEPWPDTAPRPVVRHLKSVTTLLPVPLPVPRARAGGGGVSISSRLSRNIFSGRAPINPFIGYSLALANPGFPDETVPSEYSYRINLAVARKPSPSCHTSSPLWFFFLNPFLRQKILHHELHEISFSGWFSPHLFVHLAIFCPGSSFAFLRCLYSAEVYNVINGLASVLKLNFLIRILSSACSLRASASFQAHRSIIYGHQFALIIQHALSWHSGPPVPRISPLPAYHGLPRAMISPFLNIDSVEIWCASTA